MKRSRLIWLILAILFLVNAVLFGVHYYLQVVAADRRRADLARMLAACAGPVAARATDPAAFRYLLEEREDPAWPVAAFLSAELYRLRGDQGRAAAGYRELVLWGGSDPYLDRSGGCGLTSVALWRWLEQAEITSPQGRGQAKELLAVAPALLETRLGSGIFSTVSTLAGLPQMEPEIRRRLAILAWQLGEKEQAANLFFGYLKVATGAGLSPEERDLFDYLVRERGVSPERVALYRGERLFTLGRYQDAAVELAAAVQSSNAQVKAEAALNQEQLRRQLQRKLCADPEALRLLAPALEASTDPDLAQRALSLLGAMYAREGCGVNVLGFRESLTRLVREYPTGKLADDALNQLGAYYLYQFWQQGDRSNLEESLRFYGKLVEFKGENEFRDSMRIMPALGHYSIGDRQGLLDALSSLQSLERERPSGPLHFQALFWCGRISEELGDGGGAQRYFNRIVEENPYGYYAVRAAMHLNLGREARRLLEPDRKSASQLRALAERGKPARDELSERSPYHRRLDEIGGIYRTALTAYYDTRRRFSRSRLCDIELQKLDAANALVPVALLLSLRQDALTAAATPFQAENRVEVAGALGRNRDWCVAMQIVFDSNAGLKGKRAIQRERSYLATAYPPAFVAPLKKAAARFGVKPELLYGVIRNESAFNPAAWSAKGAIGLFQFLPPTFREQNKQWRLLDNPSDDAVNQYLLSAQTSIPLGARWCRELLQRNDGNPLFALIEHNAGADALAQWQTMWRRLGRYDDVEFMTDSIRFQETRGFVRNVLFDYWMAGALRLF